MNGLLVSMRIGLIVMLVVLLLPAAAQNQDAAPCGIVDSFDYPIDNLVAGYDDFGLYRARFGGNHTGLDIGQKAEAGEFATALTLLDAATKQAGAWPEGLKARAQEARAGVVRAGPVVIHAKRARLPAVQWLRPGFWPVGR